METLPIFLNLAGKRVAVVGGGGAAARRVEALARAGARVRVFAARLDHEFDALGEATSYERVAREPTKDDLAGCVLCYVATGEADEDERATRGLQGAGPLVNVADRPDLSDFIASSVVRRPPLIVAISTGGAAPMLGRMLKARLESAIPAAYGRLAALMGRARERVAEALATTRARRRFWERVLEGPIAELALAGDEAGAEAALGREIDRAARGEEGEPAGEVYLVGAGPGDPDLLTFRAVRLMQKADVVLYDRLIGEGVLDLVRREAERIDVGKRPDRHPAPQDEISELMVRLARQGKRVLRLKGGDPFIFGRGGEEIATLAERGIPFQVCPGITAAAACSAFSGIPLTHRDHAQACVLVAGHGKDGPTDLDWGALMRPNQTVAIYMGLARIEDLTRDFVARGVDPRLPAAVVDNGARANQRVVVGTVATIAAEARAAELRGPAIIIVGSVVKLRDELEWRAAAQEASAAAAAATFMLANPADRPRAEGEDG